ncbi:hypothetical protein JCM8202_004415 [Rhodotorula sphaerocarpa]
MPITLPGFLYSLPRNPAVAVGLPLVLGFIDGTGSNGSVKDWYPNLRRPPAVPPSWAFPAAWTILYLSMGWASHLIVQKYDVAVPGSAAKALADSALKWYWGQFALNMLWSPIFFGLKQPFYALLDIVPLTTSTYVLAAKAFQVDPRTIWFLAPYCAWTTYATYLNAGFAWLNDWPSFAARKRD